MLTKCPECGAEYKNILIKCPECGLESNTTVSEVEESYAWRCIVAFVFGIILSPTIFAILRVIGKILETIGGFLLAIILGIGVFLICLLFLLIKKLKAIKK